MPGDILDLIDNALEDWSSGPDAMRWRPEGSEGHGPPSRPPWHDLPTWRPGIDVLPRGNLDIWPHAVTPGIGEIQEGHIVSVGGQEWRVLRRTRNEDGSYTFDLGPAVLPPLPFARDEVSDVPYMISRYLPLPLHLDCRASMLPDSLA